ncbi:MAG: hypothetical protein KDA96_11855 [Planctomycetaceae bacterium]|nr:hypothetical protein [Planctomycetaceae bacterium]
MKRRVICGLFFVLLTPPIFAGQLEGEVKVPASFEKQGIVADAVVVLCRNNKSLAKTTVAPDGKFSLDQPEDGQPFDLAIISYRFAPYVIRNLRQIRTAISVELQTPVPSSGKAAETEAYVRQVRSALRSIAEAEDVIPPDPDLIQRLKSSREIATLQRRVSMLVPAYFHPVTAQVEWKRLERAATLLRDDLVVILNVNSGSGMNSGVEPAYQETARVLNSKKVRWVGYVDVNYGRRPAAEVIRDVQFWLTNYPGMCGIFVDRAPSTTWSEMKSVCSQVRQLLTAKKIRQPLLIANPGTVCDETLVGADGFNWVCISENPLSNSAFPRPAWADANDGVAVGSIVYDVTSTQQVEDIVRQTAMQQGEFLFVSDQNGKSETLWTRLPAENIYQATLTGISGWNKSVTANAKATEGLRKPSSSL